MWRGVLHPPVTAGKRRQESGSCCCWSAARAPGLHSIPHKQHHGTLCNPYADRTTYIVPYRKHFFTGECPKPPQRDTGSVPLWATYWTCTIASAGPRQACRVSMSCWGQTSFIVVRGLQSQHRVAQHWQSPQQQGGSIISPYAMQPAALWGGQRQIISPQLPENICTRRHAESKSVPSINSPY